jgi:hypothetical protein
MNELSPTQQAVLNSMPREHRPATYLVQVALREMGGRNCPRAHTTYCRASSARRARYLGLHTVRRLYGPIYRRKGLVASTASATLLYPLEEAHAMP